MTPEDAALLFKIDETPVAVEPIGRGLIHRTYGVHFQGAAPRYVLQQINTLVFANLEALESNLNVVCATLRQRAEARDDDLDRMVLRLIPTVDGGLIARDCDGLAWRMSCFVAESVTVDVIESVTAAYKAAQAFANFHLDLWDLPAESVEETIPDFHNTPLRYAALKRAISSCAKESDRLQRARQAIELINLRAESLSRVETGLSDGSLSSHVCHNDTKISNLLLDLHSHSPLCVIDLDTIGPGSPLLDVGDLLRSGATTASEEEGDLALVSANVEYANAIIDGFFSVVGNRMNAYEREGMAFGGWLITMEQAIRYLTDYLLGDPYYGESYSGHNLVRAENQLTLATSMEESLKIPWVEVR